MKKILFLLMVVLVIVPLNVNAANLEISKDGWESVGEVEVQLIRSKFTMYHARETNDVVFSDNNSFGFIESTQYTSEQLEDGTFDAARDTTYTYGSSASSALYLVYKKPLTVGVNNIDGSISMKFKEAAIDKEGNLYDVKMTVDNIKIESTFVNTKPVSLLHSTTSALWMNTSAAWQEVRASELGKGPALPNTMRVGMNYDVSFVVYKTGTTEVINKKMGMSFIDLDAGDALHLNGNDRTFLDDNNAPQPYAESITLINGVADKVHMTSGNFLNVSNTTYGNNTKFSATKVDTTTRDSGFITLVNSSGFKYNWTGSLCATKIDLIPLFEIKTSTSGDYPDKVDITESIDSALWKSNKEIVMTPEKTYYVDKITIDGVTINYNSLPLSNGKRVYTNGGITYNFTESNGVVKYSFVAIMDDHKIDVSVKKGGYIIHYDGNGGKGTMEDTVAKFDVEGALSKNKFTKDGYTFVGWKAYYKDANGKLVELKDDNDKIITFKDSDKFLNLYGDNEEEVTLVAQWEMPLLPINPKTGGIISGILIIVMLVGSFVVVSYIKRKSIKNNAL